MRIEVLGCSGAEFPGHHHPSLLLDDNILLDAGSATNVLDEKDQAKIRHIFVTHAHLDHVKAIPFLADNISLGNWRHHVNIFGISHVLTTIKAHLLNSSIWPDLTVASYRNKAALKFQAVRVAEPLELAGYTITPYEMKHSVPAAGYLIEDKNDGQKRLFYTGDTGSFDCIWEKIGQKQINCLIAEVSFPNSMRKIAALTGHLTARLLKEQLAKADVQPERIYITHPKPQYLGVISKELESLKMRNLSLLSDGQIIDV